MPASIAVTRRGRKEALARRDEEILDARAERTDLSIRELAEMFQCSPQTILNASNRALQTLKLHNAETQDKIRLVQVAQLHERRSKLDTQQEHVEKRLTKALEVYDSMDGNSPHAWVLYSQGLEMWLQLETARFRLLDREAKLTGIDLAQPKQGNTSEMLVAFQRGAEDILASMPGELEEIGAEVGSVMPLIVKHLHGLLTKIQDAATNS